VNDKGRERKRKRFKSSCFAPNQAPQSMRARFMQTKRKGKIRGSSGISPRLPVLEKKERRGGKGKGKHIPERIITKFEDWVLNCLLERRVRRRVIALPACPTAEKRRKGKSGNKSFAISPLIRSQIFSAPVSPISRGRRRKVGKGRRVSYCSSREKKERRDRKLLKYCRNGRGSNKI